MKALNAVRVVLSFALSVLAVHQVSAQTFSQHRDIGAVSVAGNASSAGGNVTVSGSGEDIWGTADEFHFLYVTLDGDMQIVARVTGVQFTDGWAKAGLMARETLDANSRNTMVFITPQNITGVQWRDALGGSTSYIDGGTVISPYWLKLVRSGNTFTGYKSPDGVTWTQIGASGIGQPSTLYVGLAVTSHHDGTLCTATFDNVTISGGNGGGGGGGTVPPAPTGLFARAVSSSEIFLQWIDNSANETSFRVERSTDGVNFQQAGGVGANARAFSDKFLQSSTRYCYRVFAVNSAGDSAPSNVDCDTTMASGGGTTGWQDQDIGAVSSAGSFSQSGSTYTVGGSGYDIWDNNDEFHYAYQNAPANGQIVARITGMAITSPWAKAGVMWRESLDPGARNVLLALTPGHGLAFQWRGSAGSATFYSDAGAASAPVWVKLVRAGDVFTGFRSADGVNWTQVATVGYAQPTALGEIGLAVTSHFDGQVCIANFENVSITGATGGGGGGGGGTTLPAPPSALTATAVDTNAIRITWRDNSTNETGFVLQRSTDGSSFATLTVAGANITNAWDLALAPGTRYWYRVAATNNAGLSPYSNVADATTLGGTGTPAAPTDLFATAVSQTQVKLTWKDLSSNETGFVLERSLMPFQGYQQIALLGPNTQSATDTTVSPGNTYHYRLAATNSAGISPYSNIASVTTPSLPAPWQTLGISAGGSASLANGVFRVSASSGDIFGTSDSFFFAYQPLSGDQTITAAIDGLDLVSGSFDPWARVGLMIREKVSTGSKNAMVFLSHEHGAGFTFRPAEGGNTQYVPGPASARFLRLSRTANTFSAYSSADGTSWQLIGSGTIDMANDVFVGLAVTSHSYSSEVAGRFSQVSVGSSGGGGGGGGSGGSLPNGWAQQDVGSVTLAGSASYNQGTFTVKGDGSDIWGSSDAFHYVYTTMGANGELVARVTAIQNTEPWAKVGLMFRQSTLADSANALVMATADHGTGLQARSVDGGQSSYVPGPFYTAPVWLKLRKQGTTLTGYTSLDGSNWTTIGSFDLPQSNPTGFPPLWLIGLAVTSHNTSALNTSMFDNVTFTALP